MAGGQDVLATDAQRNAVRAVEDRVKARARARDREHAAQLRDVLSLRSLYDGAGEVLTTPALLAMLLRVSELQAGRMLAQAEFLAALPGALSAMDDAVLTVEASWAVQDLLGPLDLPVRLQVWEQLLEKLRADDSGGAAVPPARLRDWLRRKILRIDREGAERRRQQRHADGGVAHRRRDDGLVDVFLLGVDGLTAQACLARIAQYAAPTGPHDLRSADERRRDAATDLLLGRVGHESCSCLPGSPVPCGSDVQVLMPMGAGLDTTDEVAELVGHGPIEPDLLASVLAAAPVLTPVWVDERGVPVAVGRPLPPLAAGDLDGAREAIRRLAAEGPPTEIVPRAPDDHDHLDDADAGQVLVNAVLGRPPAARGHPPGQPGPYRVPARLRRLLQVRRPRCEWPGCGRWAVRCRGDADLDHDDAWPDGPACGCNVGPLCRRHHRIKQRGWTKDRTRDGVRWTSPSGRRWLSPTPHEPPARPVRPSPRRDPFARLSPSELEWELFLSDPGHARWNGLDAPEPEVVDPLTLPAGDELGELLRSPEAAWTIDLRDPWAWDTDLQRVSTDDWQ